MRTIRRAADRGHADHGWLKSNHTFSFANYYDPKHMGFRALRVINDDRVAGGRGFGAHSHADMEIISYVLEGALAHEDSTGTGSTIRHGDVQRMTAGTGVTHSEMNPAREPVHFLQIWIQPEKRGLPPSYQEKTFGDAEKRGTLRVVASPDGRDGSVTLHANAVIYAGLFDANESSELVLATGRHAWVQIARGTVRVNGEVVSDGDGVALTGESVVRIEGIEDGEVLVFDLA